MRQTGKTSLRSPRGTRTLTPLRAADFKCAVANGRVTKRRQNSGVGIATLRDKEALPHALPHPERAGAKGAVPWVSYEIVTRRRAVVERGAS